MNGILLIDKPKGWTSHDVVAKVRSILKQSGLNNTKVGHTGTLDPMATGLLMLVLGSYTKRAQEFAKLDKTYEVTMRLDATSTTGDAEGVITPVTRITWYRNSITRRYRNIQLDKKAIIKVMEEFVGEIKQIPPAYSAIKIDGQRAYKLARAGKEVKLQPRKVKIYEITDIKISRPIQLNYATDNRSSMPEVKFTARVSSGTYIRSLVEDIGQKLGTGAYMTALRRTTIGGFSIKNALELDRLNIKNLKNSLELLP